MDEVQLKRLWAAIDKTEKLFQENGDPEDWSDNIVDGSKGLRSRLEWGNYIKWLHNSVDFEVEHDMEFADMEKCSILDEYEYPEQFETIEYKNGTDTVLHIKNNHFHQPPSVSSSQDDEKTTA